MPTFPNTTSAYGRWSLLDVREAEMGSNWPKVRDPYFSNVGLLLSGDGVNSNPQNIITDSSPNNFNLTVVGDTKSAGFHPYLEGWSGYFDGTGDFLTMPTGNSALAFENSNFTVEAWVYRISGTNQACIFVGQSDLTTVAGSSCVFYIAPSHTADLYIGGTVYGITSPNPPLGSWNHVAWVRSGGTFKSYLNGIQVGSRGDLGTGSVNVGATAGLPAIGAFSNGNNALHGYISNLRVLKGVALYTTNFTPPTGPLTAITSTSLLTCNSNRFVDRSTNNIAVTPSGNVSVVSHNPYNLTNNSTNLGSAYLDGTGDYLTVLNVGSALTFGTSPFTIEAWIYPTASTSDGRIIWIYGSTVDVVAIYVNSGTNAVTFVLRGTSLAETTITHTNTAARIGTWTHVALVRNGTEFAGYVNGVKNSTTISTSAAFNEAQAQFFTQPRIGAKSNTDGAYFSGYISDFRAIKGTALYTANFTPPTVPLTPVANTSLLTCQYKSGHNNNNFLDESVNNLVVTRAGNPTQGSFSPYGDRWSAYFDGAGDMLLVNSLPGPLTGDFTYECWAYATSGTVTYRAIFGIDNYASTTPFRLYQYGTNFQFWYTGTAGNFINSNTINLNQWYHLAVTRSGTSIRFFVNGIQVGSTLTSSANYPTSNFRIGMDSGSLYPFLGYISNVRVINGRALYLTDFTPPNEPLTAVSGTVLLTCQNNRFRDNSTNNYTVTRSGDVRIQNFGPTINSRPYNANINGGSIYLDGSGDYLSSPSNPAFSLGTGDFTIEGWVYYNTTTNSGVFQIGATLFPLQNGIGLGLNASLFWMLYHSNGSSTSASTAPVAGLWHHFAVVRSSGTTKVYVNGVATSISVADTTNYTGTVLGVGGIYSTSFLMNGYISNFRIVKGTALYTSNFTPTTEPLTAVTNTVFLLNGTNGAIVDHTGLNNVETVGDAEVYTAQSRWGLSSIYFDGTGDYLTIPSSPQFTMGSSGNFTIECWIHPTQYVNASTGIVTTFTDFGVAGGYTNRWFLGIGNTASSNKIRWYNSLGTGIIESLAAPALNSWTHIAVVRSSTTITLYVNGVSQSTQTTNQDYSTQSQLTVGSVAGSGGGSFIGYINDLRITKGIARYTTNFTPSSVHPRL